MVQWLETLWNEMINGNFSFAILVVGIAQLVIMSINLGKGGRRK